MKVHEEMEVQLHSLITSVVDSNDWAAPHTSRFSPQEKSPQYQMKRRLCWSQRRYVHVAEDPASDIKSTT
jgi:hypothetical protein